ncbi:MULTISPECIES: DUF7446 family protein [Bacillus]|uniref:DUF7446 family protein n=1 Tax=Bacillus TaxID=1386 RepID=UPI0003155EE9|nr:MULTISPECIES: hypothetical protein [Bacillus]
MKNLVLRVSGLGNKIYAGTINKKNPSIMNDSRKDVTDEAIKAVFQHLKEEHRRNKRGSKSFGYGFEGMGEIHFHPPVENK